jgi:3-deoxy-D-manno-octulosonate 8-phosphate phosphatase (KDO 8-P phosphatase)
MKLNKLQYLLFDVDGVMTSGQFLYSKYGKEYKVFGLHDNDGTRSLSDKIEIIFITADKRGYPISNDVQPLILTVMDWRLIELKIFY